MVNESIVNTTIHILKQLKLILSSIFIDFGVENNDNDSKFEVVGIKTFFLKFTLDLFLEKTLWLKNLKMLCHGHMLLVIIAV